MKKSVLRNWTQSHGLEFNHIKKLLTKSLVLQYYNEKEPLVLSVDSSKDGIGVVLLQNSAPVVYASKSLNETQRQYAQIEKEMLAIAYGCQRFHQYLFGKSFVVERDHKPVEAIFKKPLNKCHLRLQRLIINLQNYDLTVQYKPGSKLYITDTLSRASQKEFEIIENNVEAQVNLIDHISVSPEKKKRS